MILLRGKKKKNLKKREGTWSIQVTDPWASFLISANPFWYYSRGDIAFSHF